MDKIKIHSSFLTGKVTVPSSKSVAHRALIAGALSGKNIKICNVDISSDIKATLMALESLGISHKIEKQDITLQAYKLKRNESVTIDALESGSTLRFMIPISVALNNKTLFLGNGRLPNRPLDTYFQLFEKQGIHYQTKENAYLPLTVEGCFQNNIFEVAGDISSQFVTGLMFAGIVNDQKTTIHITTKLESRPYVELTLDILNVFGHHVTFKNQEIEIIKGETAIEEYQVEKDWSQAAFFLCAGAINGEVTLLDMNLNSKQGDRKILDILKQFGAELSIKNTITIKKSQLKGCDIDVADIPDLVPILSVLACAAQGTTNIYNAKRLRIKESDRLEAMFRELSKMGADIEMGEDFLKITGGKKLSGATLNSHNDHRIVMSLAVAALLSDGEVVIEDYKAIEKSYPMFFQDFMKLGGIINE